MEVKIESSSTVKPAYDPSLSTPITGYIPLGVFDKVQFDIHVGVIYVYPPLAVPTATLKLGLQRVLAVYREWAGRLVKNHKGVADAIILNDQGVKFVEASVDNSLDQTLDLMKPSPVLLSLHPPLEGVDELLQVQVTRFACGSMVIGITSHHVVADGHATGSFLVTWARACRGVDIGHLPLHDRTSFFIPRDPPEIEFHHVGAEYTSRKILKDEPMRFTNDVPLEDIVVHRVHFSVEFLTKLKAGASFAEPPSDITKNNSCTAYQYSTFECVVAHLWRAITRARSVSADEASRVRISVNGRWRMKSRVPNDYFGNLVLWAFPESQIQNLLSKPLSHTARLIHETIAKVNDRYFLSFVDFTETTVKDDPEIVASQVIDKHVFCPNVDVECWLRLPLCDLDFGCGSPCDFIPAYFPYEGNIFILPSCIGDGSIEAFVPVLKEQLDSFQQNCYSLDQQRAL